jgi:hypothetical protein
MNYIITVSTSWSDARRGIMSASSSLLETLLQAHERHLFVLATNVKLVLELVLELRHLLLALLVIGAGRSWLDRLAGLGGTTGGLYGMACDTVSATVCACSSIVTYSLPRRRRSCEHAWNARSCRSSWSEDPQPRSQEQCAHPWRRCPC